MALTKWSSIVTIHYNIVTLAEIATIDFV